jgi:signal peptidase II
MKRAPANRCYCFVLLTGIGLLWDLYTKHIVFRDLGFPGRSSDWVYRWFDDAITFRLFTSFNEGALWGFGQGYAWAFATLSIIAVFGVVYWLFFFGAARSWWLTLSLAFVMAGTLGNLFDRLALHQCIVDGAIKYAVRDFLLFTFGTFHWPVFNFADVFLVTGAIMLVLQSFMPVPEQQADDAPVKATPPPSAD